MNAVRKATPDSEAVASSEDERPWPSSTSFGSLPRKDSNVPGLPGGIWSAQRRGSFKIAETAQRNAAREAARLGVPSSAQHNTIRAGNTPSPSAVDGPNGLPFNIPIQPLSKSGRSLSHSQGQREFLQASRGNTSAEHAIPLGLLAEEGDTESDSEADTDRPTQRARHPPIGSLQRVATMPASYDTIQVPRNGDHSQPGRDSGRVEDGAPRDRHFEAAFARMGLDNSLAKTRTQWQSHLGWDDLPPVNESRRHSLADIPTRRGSLDESTSSPQFDPWNLAPKSPKSHFPPNSSHASMQGLRYETSADDMAQFRTVGNMANTRRASEAASHLTRFNEGPTQVDSYNVPSMYKAPYVAIDDAERHTPESLRQQQQSQQTQQQMMRAAQANNPAAFRPRKMLYIVSFKCSRVDVFYLLENTGLHVREGDIVIVEADRGQDLGTVQHANITPDQARIYKRKYSEEQYKWLMMFSRNNAQGNVNPNAADGYNHNGLGNPNSNPMTSALPTIQGLPRDSYNNLKPKAIKRLANPHEIKMLSEKEHNEAKAKRTCQQKVSHLHLQMEILDAEWQWDFQKLIFYYYADHYINFKDLITDLYRIYKTRIWLSAVNPASFSQHAMGQPPSGIGPGAITSMGNSAGPNNAYTMSYGADPDPYGAVPPYRIGYETYTPNYPSIPGVPNSFAPIGAHPTPTADNIGQTFVGTPTDADPVHGGRFDDRGAWYDRSASGQQMSNDSFASRIAEQEPYQPDMNSASFVPGVTPFVHPNAAGPLLPNQRPQQPSLPHGWSWPAGRPSQIDTAGQGRSIDNQAPIGTRPISNGPQSATFSTKQTPLGTDAELRDPFRPASHSHLLRSNSVTSPNLGAFPGSTEFEGAMHSDSPSAMPRGSVSSASTMRAPPVNKQAQVKNYLSNLPDATVGYADEMSRER